MKMSLHTQITGIGMALCMMGLKPEGLKKMNLRHYWVGHRDLANSLTGLRSIVETT